MAIPSYRYTAILQLLNEDIVRLPAATIDTDADLMLFKDFDELGYAANLRITVTNDYIPECIDTELCIHLVRQTPGQNCVREPINDQRHIRTEISCPEDLNVPQDQKYDVTVLSQA